MLAIRILAGSSTTPSDRCSEPATCLPAPRAPVPSSPLPYLNAASVSASPARAPAPSPRCNARSAAVCATVTASWALHALARGCAHERRLGVCSRWQGPVRSTLQAPSASILSRGTVARACPLPRARAHDSIGESGATPSTLPCRGASLASAFRGESGVHLVLSSDATAWSLHPGMRRRQLTTPARRSCTNRRRAARRRHLRSVDTGPVAPRRDSGLPTLPPPHAPFARFGRLSPRRVLPPGPANLGLPLITRLLRKLAK